jgi:hypothetical protein
VRISFLCTVIQIDTVSPGVYDAAAFAACIWYTSLRSGGATFSIPAGHVPELQMFTASQL